MAKCAKCGATVADGVAFCGSCGAPMGTAGPAKPAAPATAGSGMAPNVAGMVAYLLTAITGLILLITDPYKDNKFVRFHALQAILYYIAAVTVWAVFWAITTIIGAFTLGFGGLLMLIPAFLIAGLMFLYWLFLLFKAYSNERYEIPYLGKMASEMAEAPTLNIGVVGALAYVLWFISAIILLVAGPYRTDKTVRFHAFQSIFYTVLYVAVAIAWLLVEFVFAFAHVYFLGALLTVVWMVIRLAFIGGWLLLMQRAAQGGRLEIPVLTDLAAKQA